MANLFNLNFTNLLSFICKLDQGGFTAEMAETAEKNPDVIKAMVIAGQKTIENSAINPFIQTVEEQIAAFRLANVEEGWGIQDEVIDELSKTAPAWPAGRDAYRSFRIRFGEGDEGVAQTFEAHVARIHRVFDKDGFWRFPQLNSDAMHMRLVAGSQSHVPVIEWITLRLDSHRKRKSVEDVRGLNSLADEGLVLAWLFPKRVEAINNADWCGWFLGYDLHLPLSEKTWLSAPCIYRCVSTNRVSLLADRISTTDAGYSVPIIL
jgi:hypothetical protein